MNVSCPDCRTTYRIDPARVPLGGVRARCIRCPGIFEVESRREERVTAGAPDAPGLSGEWHARAPETPATPTIPPSPAGSWRDRDGGDSPAPAGSTPADTGAGAASAESLGGYDRFRSPPASQGASGLGPAPFGSRDPHTRARRLARALVSDIVVYHPDRRDRSLRAGTLRQEFREEIRKSWDEYASQVGDQIARETRFFQDALNEILAEGNRLF